MDRGKPGFLAGEQEQAAHQVEPELTEKTNIDSGSGSGAALLSAARSSSIPGTLPMARSISPWLSKFVSRKRCRSESSVDISESLGPGGTEVTLVKGVAGVVSPDTYAVICTCRASSDSCMCGDTSTLRHAHHLAKTESCDFPGFTVKK